MHTVIFLGAGAFCGKCTCCKQLWQSFGQYSPYEQLSHCSCLSWNLSLWEHFLTKSYKSTSFPPVQIRNLSKSLTHNTMRFQMPSHYFYDIKTCRSTILTSQQEVYSRQLSYLSPFLVPMVQVFTLTHELFYQLNPTT